jgi:6-pyruvoyltetrahydropterin/6-carboxytetrahydropterin synthase
MNEIFITRIEHFNAAHKLYNPDWTEEKNKAIFGKCANQNYHGHNYELHVTVKGQVNQETGYAINAKTLSDIIIAKISDKADHMNLNIDVPFMAGKMTSSENFAIAIWDEIVQDIAALDASLHCIKLIETKSIYVEYYGPKK